MLEDIFSKVNASKTKEQVSNWSDSINACNDWLRKTIELSPERDNALIIGVGQADDFSLPLIVDEFKNVYLLDIDSKALDVAYCKLDISRRQKVKLVPCDITGLSERIVELYNIMNDGTSPDKIKRKFELFRDQLPKRFKPVNFNIPGCSWIFSNCITTQFLSPVIMQINPNDQEQSEIYKIATHISHRILAPYLRLIETMLKRKGILAYSTDVFKIDSDTKNIIERTSGLSIKSLAKNPLQIVKLTEKLTICIAGWNAVKACSQYKIDRLQVKGLFDSWLWNFDDKKQYIVLAYAFEKN
ncbi:hypothetical protein Tfer_3286 [Thermincola ferriacetica]|uniref:Uncharacterized protein n=1 Tax=Thermincola ferriacetica TaxID=281456 RepID=A0A0L6VZA5_9FIRM|nr:hypothetical protein [Thermincola ferriacetica]KNZ68179.1 hypothetical protein Tfer_3286 [Thermincola ferriacetica]